MQPYYSQYLYPIVIPIASIHSHTYSQYLYALSVSICYACQYLYAIAISYSPTIASTHML